MTNPDGLPAARTKIVATIGPASRDPAMLRQLLSAGMSVCRLNFSHGTHAEHSQTVANIRAAARDANSHVAVLQDLCGPKIRLGPIPGDLVECPLDEQFTLVTEKTSDDPRELTCSYPELPNELKVGDVVLFADGTVSMTVTAVSRGRAQLKVTLPGRLRSRQGLNLPGTDLAVPSLTEKDLQDLDWTAKHAADVDYVGQSLVRSAADVEWLRRELTTRGISARIVVKIEKPQAVRNLEEIVAVADAVMVARGDLGVEVNITRVPAIQKRVIALCNQVHRPVITATQMLNSMEHSNRPTRAEASDVFNAVLDGSDAVMLSGESAIGAYPVEAVSVMRQITAEAEAYGQSGNYWNPQTPASLAGLVQPITEASVDAACLAAERLSVPLIVVTTISGRTAQALSNRRPSAIILALTPKEQTARALSLCWGVRALVTQESTASDQQINFGVEWARSRGLLRAGQHVVLLRGEVPGGAGSRAVFVREVK